MLSIYVPAITYQYENEHHATWMDMAESIIAPAFLSYIAQRIQFGQSCFTFLHPKGDIALQNTAQLQKHQTSWQRLPIILILIYQLLKMSVLAI